MKKAVYIHIVLFLLIPLLGFSQDYSEYSIKAVLMGKITRFIEWPTDTASDNNTFVLSIIGDNPFNDILENIYSYKTINNKKVEIRHIQSVNQILDTDLLFISGSKTNELEKILEYTTKKSILTFSDTEYFAKKGVHVNFFITNRKIRFEINETSVRDAGLYMSFMLLSQAVIINPIN